jgi:hypothetical protein
VIQEDVMRLAAVVKSPSPVRPGFVRLSGDIVFDRDNSTRVYWVEYPEACAAEIADDGNCWLALMTLLAASSGEDVTIHLPIDPYLLTHLRAVQREWHGWDRKWKVTKFDCPNLKSLARTGQKTGAFFSGGIDSYDSILRNSGTPNDEGDATEAITDLISVHGMDIPLNLERHFDAINRHLEAAARAFKKTHLVVITNIRTLEDVYDDAWQEIAFGSALAFVAYGLSRRFKEVVIASSHEYGLLKPNGSHPLTDSLFSSKALRIVHDGAVSTRVEKTERVARSPVALAHLHVCQNKRGGETFANLNCSICEKCQRTMVTLDLLNAKHGAMTFDWSRYSVQGVSKNYIKLRASAGYYEEIQLAAVERGREDIARAVRHSLRRTTLFRFLGDMENWLLKRFPQLRKHRGQLIGARTRVYRAFGLHMTSAPRARIS